MVLVDTDEICAAIKDIYEDTRTVVALGGAGAGRRETLARAAAAQGQDRRGDRLRRQHDFDRLRFVASVPSWASTARPCWP